MDDESWEGSMTDKEIIKAPCGACGEECVTICIGYSCPITLRVKCKGCGSEFDRVGDEGIKVLSQEESIRKRPHWWADSEDPEIRKIALDELKKQKETT
jgi:hypothetical protein